MRPNRPLRAAQPSVSALPKKPPPAAGNLSPVRLLILAL